jgi:hypothetical protein
MTIRYLVVANPDGGSKPRRRLKNHLKNFIQPPSGFLTADGVAGSVKFILR